jgi:CRISPR-associated protein Cmx8
VASKKWDVASLPLFRQLKMIKKQALELVTLEYQLSQLPSSQHRSGLAGLILKIQWLRQQETFKDSVDAACEVIHLDADKATIQFNLMGLTLLLRSNYSASFEDREYRKIKTKGQQEYRTIQREIYNVETKTVKPVNFYIYQDLIPRGYLVQSLDPTANDSQIWTKLWQSATWGVLRPRASQQLPFTKMVGGTDPPEIEKIWRLLLKRPNALVHLSSTYMLGVQSKNNEGMRFDDQARFYFLLNFWSYIAQIYLPIQVDIKGKVKTHGYQIAIPDIRNLAVFCQHFPSILKQRSTKSKWDKPEAAIVDHPLEAGLRLLGSIHTYLYATIPDLDINELLFGVDIFHLFKKENDLQILSIQRYPPDKCIVEEFTQLERKIFDSNFRIQYWKNLIHKRPRITGFDRLLWDLPFSRTIGNEWFRRDFRTIFPPQYNAMKPEEINTDEAEVSLKSIDSNESNSAPNESIDLPEVKEISLERLILRMLKTYTRQKLQHLELEWNMVWSNQPPEIRNQDPGYQAYKKKREQIVRDLHHDFRHHRHPHEFLAYFASKFTGVSQYLTTDEYLFLAEQIQIQPERIQILCLLALPVL